jgi:hypothetical protein
LWLAPSVDVLIEVLEPVDPNAFETVDLMIEETRRRMAESLASLEREIAQRERRVPAEDSPGPEPEKIDDETTLQG